MVIGLNERSCSVEVPFDHFSQKHSTRSCRICQNSGVLRLELVRDRTFERKVIETWFKAQMKGLGPYMCRLAISVKTPDFRLSNWPN